MPFGKNKKRVLHGQVGLFAPIQDDLIAQFKGQARPEKRPHLLLHQGVQEILFDIGQYRKSVPNGRMVYGKHFGAGGQIHLLPVTQIEIEIHKRAQTNP
jgi:hypothetical protein